MTGRDLHDPGPDRPYDFARESDEARAADRTYGGEMNPRPHNAPTHAECREDEELGR